VAVLDIMMPGMDGLEVLGRLRAADSQLPILLLTGRDAHSDQVQGADDYVIKPFTSTAGPAQRTPYRAVGAATFAGNTDVLEVYVTQLRQKLETDGEPRRIRTPRGTGYVPITAGLA
jgi:DNA-binding response OmpR family regulator